MNLQTVKDSAVQACDHLNAISPAAPYALLTLAVFLSIYCMRRFAPRVWLKLEDKLGDNRIAQSLPAVLTGATVSAIVSGGDVGQSWKGALAGAVAPLLHHALKSYDGADAVLDAAQAYLLSPSKEKQAQVVDAAKSAVVANLPAIVAAAEKTTQQIPAAAPAVVVPPPPTEPVIVPAIPSAPVPAEVKP